MSKQKIIATTALSSVIVYHMVNRLRIMPDAAKGERIFCGGVIIAGTVGVLTSKYGNPDSPEAKPPIIPLSLVVGGVTYSVLRNIMKTTPRKSLAVSVWVGVAAIGIGYMLRKNENVKKLFSKLSESNVEYEHKIIYDAQGKIKKITSVQK